MKKSASLAIAAALLLASAGCARQTAVQDGIIVAVGIVPEAAFVDKVAGGLVEVVSMIPPGMSPENYAVSSAEMQKLSNADIYFTLRMPAEQAGILPKVLDFNSGIEIVDLRRIVGEQYPLLKASHHHSDGEVSEEQEHAGEGVEQNEDTEPDPHLWLSPKRAVVMVQAIAAKLSEIDPDNAETYQANADAYIAELWALDAEIRQMVGGMENREFLIYHPSYAYFADDYGLRMLAIEAQGKQATAAELRLVIDMARENGITTVFYQEEFDGRQAQTVADEIGGNVAKVSPLSYDYIESLRAMARALSQ